MQAASRRPTTARTGAADDLPAPPPATTAPESPSCRSPCRESCATRRDRRAEARPPRGLKHFGGYLDDDTLEKIALLRVRLKKDNSELIKYAIDELHRKHNAKRAFGDA